VESVALTRDLGRFQHITERAHLIEPRVRGRVLREQVFPAPLDKRLHDGHQRRIDRVGNVDAETLRLDRPHPDLALLDVHRRSLDPRDVGIAQSRMPGYHARLVPVMPDRLGGFQNLGLLLPRERLAPLAVGHVNLHEVPAVSDVVALHAQALPYRPQVREEVLAGLAAHALLGEVLGESQHAGAVHLLGGVRGRIRLRRPFGETLALVPADPQGRRVQFLVGGLKPALVRQPHVIQGQALRTCAAQRIQQRMQLIGGRGAGERHFKSMLDSQRFILVGGARRLPDAFPVRPVDLKPPELTFGLLIE